MRVRVTIQGEGQGHDSGQPNRGKDFAETVKMVVGCLGQAKLIIRFLFPPTCFFASTTKFSLAIWQFAPHGFSNIHKFFIGALMRFLSCFLKILVIMNNEK